MSLKKVWANALQSLGSSWDSATTQRLECFLEYQIDLEEVIKDETSGDFTTALLAMLKAEKDESSEVKTDLARKDAEVQGK